MNTQPLKSQRDEIYQQGVQTPCRKENLKIALPCEGVAFGEVPRGDIDRNKNNE